VTAHNHSEHDHAAPHDHEGHEDHHAQMVRDFRRRFWVSLALTLPVLLLSPAIAQALAIDRFVIFPGSVYLLWIFATIVFIYGGQPFLTGMRSELADKNPGMMTLIALAISVAYAYSTAVVLGFQGHLLFWEVVTLIDVMLLGHWLEMKSVMSASGALGELVKLLPAQAHKFVADNQTQDVPVAELVVGDRILAKPGEKIPSDGVVRSGSSSVNQAMLTGESQPVTRQAGEKVIGGTVNGESSLTIEVEKTGDQTYLAQMLATVKHAQQSRSRSQNLADRAALILTIVALVVGSLTFIAWMLLDAEVAYALERTVTVMVITCPHALGLAVPLVVAVATSLAAGSGLLIRNRNAFEQARHLDAIVFDKTGTLTEGRFGVTEIVPLADADRQTVLALAAAVEHHSEHPIAKALVDHARQQKLPLAVAEQFQAIAGKGAAAMIDAQQVLVVSAGYLREQQMQVPERPQLRKLAEQGKTVIYVVCDGSIIGAIALADIIRDSAREALAKLKQLGIKVMMLTGDSTKVAAWVATELGLDDYFAEVLPEAKAGQIKQLQQRGLRVGMVGDGINDAPALATADVGFAIGTGTDIAMESADIVLVKSNPRDVAALVVLARAHQRKMWQNLFWATGYNVIAIPLAAGVLAPAGIVLPPAVGAVVMSVSTIIVAVNARMLYRTKDEMSALSGG